MLGRFGLEGLEDLVGIVGLDPRAEEARRHAQMRHVVDDLFELETGEPGVEHVLADRGPQPGADPLEQFALAAIGSPIAAISP